MPLTIGIAKFRIGYSRRQADVNVLEPIYNVYRGHELAKFLETCLLQVHNYCIDLFAYSISSVAIVFKIRC